MPSSLALPHALGLESPGRPADRYWVTRRPDGLISSVTAGAHWVRVLEARPLDGTPLHVTGACFDRIEHVRSYAAARDDLADALSQAIDVAWPTAYPAPELWS
jgi:hypothetical protein